MHIGGGAISPREHSDEQGAELLVNFLKLKGGKWAENPESGVLDNVLPPFEIESLNQNGKPVEGPAADAATTSKTASKIPSILEKIYAKRLSDVSLANPPGHDTF